VNDSNGLAPLLALMAFAGPMCPPADTPDRVARCKSLYDNCVDVSQSQHEYVECRAAVDAQCLDTVTEERP